MFKVSRSQPGPDCSKDYRSKAVIEVLRRMFYGKCYLCEDEVSDPVVEHFVAHRGDNRLKYSWDNLFYACHRCNSIKEATIDNKNLAIHDCTDKSLDISLVVKCLCPSVPDNNVIVEPQNESEKTKNTADLLDRCYNEDNTGSRRISRELLHEKLFDYYCTFLQNRRTLKSRDSLQQAKNDAKQHLNMMTGINYPFSVFWKWHIITDKFLNNQFSDKL